MTIAPFTFKKVVTLALSLLLLVGASLILKTCVDAQEEETLQTLASPDGRSKVQIVRLDSRGPGNHWGATIVRMQLNGRGPFRDVSIFIDNNRDKPIVQATWLGPSRLNVVFDKVNIFFQAVRVGWVEIVYEAQDGTSPAAL